MDSRIFALTAALIIVVAFAGAASTGLFSLNTPEEKPIVVGWIGPLTGFEAVLGKPNMQGVELAVEEINQSGGIDGRKLKAVFEDDLSTMQGALTAFQKLSSVEGSRFIFVEAYGKFTALVPHAEERSVLIINPLDTSDELAGISENAFAIGVYDEGIGITLAEFSINELKNKTAAVIFRSDEPFIHLVKNGFSQRFTELGGRVLLTDSYAGKTSDFRSILLKAEEKNPDALVVLGYDKAGLLLRQARELGLNTQFLGIDTFSSQNFMENAGGAAEGAYFTFWLPDDSSISKQFMENFEELFGEEPENILYTATGYDSMRVLAEAMRQCDNPEDVACVKKELKNIKDFPGLMGSLTMDSDNIVRSIQEQIYVIEGQGFHRFE